MAHLDLAGFSARPELSAMLARRRQRSLAMLGAMCCAALTIVGFAALFLAATF